MKYIKRIGGIGILLLAVGCATTGNLPDGARLVGGGLRVLWNPPTDGTAILVERTTGKTMATKTISPGDPFTFDVALESDAEILEAVFFNASPSTNAQFLLYFVPSSRKP